MGLIHLLHVLLVQPPANSVQVFLCACSARVGLSWSIVIVFALPIRVPILTHLEMDASCATMLCLIVKFVGLF